MDDTAEERKGLLEPEDEKPSIAGTSAPAPAPSALPTVLFCIPFPEAALSSKNPKTIPPFVLYSPLAAALQAPAEGEAKESLIHKTQRNFQESQRQAQEAVAAGNAGVKAKVFSLVGRGIKATKNSRIEFLSRTPSAKEFTALHVVHPPELAEEEVKTKLTTLLQATKAGYAICLGLI